MSDSEDETTKEHQLKFVLVGDGTAGKTSIVVRYTLENFEQAYTQTIGLDFFLKRIVLADHSQKMNVDRRLQADNIGQGSVSVTIQLWDIGGQTIGGKMIDNYLSGAQAVLFVYDLTNQATFDNLQDWWETVKNSFKGKEHDKMPHFALVANKGDLEHLRVVKQERHAQFAKEHGMSSHSLSAKSGDQVKLCFQKVAADVLGIVLTKNEMLKSTRVLKADMVQHSNNEMPMRATTQTKSSFCILQ